MHEGTVQHRSARRGCCAGRTWWIVLADCLVPLSPSQNRSAHLGILTPTVPPTPRLQFDVFVVIVSIMTVLVDYLFPLSPQALQLVRVLRVARIFKLVPKIKGLRMMFLTFVWSLPALFNVGSVTFILMYIYAVSWGAGGRCGKGVNRCGAEAACAL